MKFLRFDVLQLEASRGCRYDYVAIFEGSRINNTRLLGILRKYSEHIPKIFKKYYSTCNIADLGLRKPFKYLLLCNFKLHAIILLFNIFSGVVYKRIKRNIKRHEY